MQIAENLLKFKSFFVNFHFWIFLVLIFCIPFNTRKVLEVVFNYSNGSSIFSEWGSIFLYGTDVLLVLLLIFWLVSLLIENKKVKLDFSFLLPVCLFGFFIMISIISLMYADIVSLGWYRIMKLVEFFAFFVYVIYNIKGKNKTFYTYITYVMSCVFLSIVAIFQFFFQSSVGLTVFGEGILNTKIENVAEIIVSGVPFLRSYGTMPHPNVLGGFLMVGLFLSIYVFAQLRSVVKRIVFCFLIIIILLGLIFTFSRSSWLGLVIGLLVFGLILPKKRLHNVLSKKSFYIPLFIMVLAVIFILVTCWPFITARTTLDDSYGDMAKSFRLELLDRSFHLISFYPLFGQGIGNFVTSFYLNSPTFDIWKYQPVHNVFILIFVELGFLGLLFFVVLCIYGILKMFHVKHFISSQNVSRETKGHYLNFSIKKAVLLSAFAGLITIMMFDHYLFDIQQGQLLFWFILGSMYI